MHYDVSRVVSQLFRQGPVDFTLIPIILVSLLGFGLLLYTHFSIIETSIGVFGSLDLSNGPQFKGFLHVRNHLVGGQDLATHAINHIQGHGLMGRRRGRGIGNDNDIVPPRKGGIGRGQYAFIRPKTRQDDRVNALRLMEHATVRKHTLFQWIWHV